MQKDYTKIDEETLKKIQELVIALRPAFSQIKDKAYVISEIGLENEIKKIISLSEQSLLERVEKEIPKKGKPHPNELFFMSDCPHCCAEVNKKFVTAKITEVRDDTIEEFRNLLTSLKHLPQEEVKNK